MKLIRFFCLLFISSALSFPAKAQQLIFEENFSNGIPSNWYLVNTDNLTPASAVDTFDNAWIPFIYSGDTCAASTSFYTPSGQSADYLISPRIAIDAYSKLVWSARSYDASYPDSYLVLISTTDSLTTSFTDTIWVEDEENFYWQTRSVQLDLEGYASQDIFVAFKNITTDGFILMIDNVKLLSSDFAQIERNQIAGYRVYPNPASETLNVYGFQSGDIISVYSLCGKLVMSSNQSKLDISSLDNGYYTYLIQTENGPVSGVVTKL